jgi:hypothetical protein
MMMLFVFFAIGINAAELNELLAQSSTLAQPGESSSHFFARMQSQASDSGAAAERNVARNPLCARYNPGNGDPGVGNRPSSALVTDNCSGGQTNYCWTNGVLINSYEMLTDSPYSPWNSPPDFGGPVTSCLDACAILFGPGNWECSTSSSSIDNTAWVDVIYQGCSVQAENFREPSFCPANPDVPASASTE